MLGLVQHKDDNTTKIFCDSGSAISLTKNPVFHGDSKHIVSRTGSTPQPRHGSSNHEWPQDNH